MAVSDLAHHFMEGGCLDRGFTYAMQAAADAATLFAYTDSLLLYEQARDCAEALGWTDELPRIDTAVGDVFNLKGEPLNAAGVYERALAATQEPAEQVARRGFFLGRDGIFEVLPMTERIRGLMRALDRKQTLIDLLGRVLEEEGLQVIVGDDHGEEHPDRLRAIIASADVLKVLGLGPTVGRSHSADEDHPDAEPVAMSEWPEQVKLANEKEALGLYLTGHPFDAVQKDAKFFVDGRLGDLAKEPPPAPTV